VQSFSYPSPEGLMTIFYCLRFDIPQHGGPGLRIYTPQVQDGPVIPPGTRFPFRCPLRLTGLRWRYSNLRHMGLCLINHKETEFILNNLSNSVRTSQETHYVSATKPNRLMLFRKTVAVYCEKHTGHINTLCEKNPEF
jgi:hypothetical protein